MHVWRFWPWRARGPTRHRCTSVRFRREYGIPERYLVQILLQLKSAGLVASTRGASGGYRLARDASSISLSQILTAVDGPDNHVAPHALGRRATDGFAFCARSGKTSGPPNARCSTTPPSPSSPNSHHPMSGSFEQRRNAGQIGPLLDDAH